MRIAKIEHNSVSNGPGIRTVIWCQGCSLHCYNCHNQSTWDPLGGREMTQEDIREIYKELEKPWVQGVTLSGGHPLESYHIYEVTELAKNLKKRFPHKDIWLYTGRTWDFVCNLPIVNYVDVVVDGEYRDEERDITLPYCGSRNQRVIDVRKTFKDGQLTLYKGE